MRGHDDIRVVEDACIDCDLRQQRQPQLVVDHLHKRMQRCAEHHGIGAQFGPVAGRQRVVLEAMASGLPVVAYDYACASQYVEHGVSGWLSPLGQVNTFIQTLYQLPARLQLKQMGIHALKHVKQSGWQQPVYQMEQALYQVVKEFYRV